MLETLGKRTGMLGVIFRKAQNKIQDPAKLRRLIVDLIDKARPSTDLRDSLPPPRWSSLSGDVKGDAYEGLLRKNAEDVKGGAGQELSRFSAGSAKWLRFDDALPRFAVTPRPLIAAMVDVVAPQPDRPFVIRPVARVVSCSRRTITWPNTTRSTGCK